MTRPESRVSFNNASYLFGLFASVLPVFPSRRPLHPAIRHEKKTQEQQHNHNDNVTNLIEKQQDGNWKISLHFLAVLELDFDFPLNTGKWNVPVQNRICQSNDSHLFNSVNKPVIPHHPARAERLHREHHSPFYYSSRHPAP